MQVKIEVTAEDIRNGKRNLADACPVALALTRVIKWLYPTADESLSCVVGWTKALFSGRNVGSFHANVPADLTSWVIAFDDNGVTGLIRPTTFILTFNQTA